MPARLSALEGARADDGGFQRTRFRHPAAKKHNKPLGRQFDGGE
jgi:hypothetical protein